MRRLGIEELKKIEIEILEEVDAFCRENNIRYSICGGTLLGAVRHKGYIPWDDDIDIMMPRSDYDRFLRTFTSKDNYLINLGESADYIEHFTKIIRKGTFLEYTTLKRRLWGVNIDVFPVDGVPDDGGVYAATLRDLHKKIEYIFPYYRFVGEKKLLWFAKYCFKRLARPTTDSVKSIKDRMNRMVRENLPESSPGSCEIFDDFRIIPIASDIFLDYTDLEFEGRPFRAIRDADAYLSAMYGDYMTLPPEEQRVSNHFYKAYIDE